MRLLKLMRKKCGKKDIMHFAGAWKEMSGKDIKNMKSAIKSLRRKF